MTMQAETLVRQTFRDACEQERGLAGWQQHYTQTHAGTYSGALTTLNLPGLAISRERVDVPVAQRTSAPAGTLVFAASLAGVAWRVNAARQAADAFTMMRGGFEVMAVAEEPSDLLLVVADLTALGLSVADTPSMMICDGDEETEAAKAWFVSLLAACANDAAGLPDELRAFLPGLVTDRLLALTRRLRRDGIPVRGRGAYEIFRKAEAVIEEETDAPMTVTDLARRLDLPPEIVREAFVETVGTGPGAWLRRQRLNGAHRDLRTAGQSGETISQIAMRWGFWHLGRFSGYYADLFGETPSQTLKGRTRA